MAGDASRWTDELLDQLRTEGDPPADAAVTAYYAQLGLAPHELVGRLIHEDTLAPEDQVPEVAAFLDDSQPLPVWCDLDAVARCERLFGAIGPEVGWALMTLSFPAGYAGARGARVLALTARLESDTRRRVFETAQMVLDAFAPRGLLPGGRGYRDIRRVRLMHAGVRHLITHDPRVAVPTATAAGWDEQWGMPISQEELLAFLMPMTLTVFDGLAAMGLQLQPQQQDDYLHTWCVIGALMGVRDDLLPIDRASAEVLWAAERRRQYAASADGQLMTADLLTMVGRFMPRGLRGLPRSLIHEVLGEDVCTMLDIPPADWTRLLFGPLRRAMHRTWLDEQHHRLMGKLARAAGRSAVDGFVATERGGHRPPYSVPPELAAEWGSSPT